MTGPTTALICPKCQGTMRSYERSGITVDQCAECRGIFLDRGELERLLEAEDTHYGGSGGGRREQTVPAREDRGSPDGDERDLEQDDPRERGSSDRHGGSRDDGSRDGGQRKRRGGFLGDLLDFG